MKIIDRSKATLPIGYSLYSVRLTYGREFNALVSANNEREAKDIVKNVYDYLHPKILSVKFVNDNHKLIHDLTRELIFGKLNIIENGLRFAGKS